jgi:hypothetical protein
MNRNLFWRPLITTTSFPFVALLAFLCLCFAPKPLLGQTASSTTSSLSNEEGREKVEHLNKIQGKPLKCAIAYSILGIRETVHYLQDLPSLKNENGESLFLGYKTTRRGRLSFVGLYVCDDGYVIGVGKTRKKTNPPNQTQGGRIGENAERRIEQSQQTGGRIQWTMENKPTNSDEEGQRYYPLPTGNELAALQRNGQFPTQLPSYHLNFWDYFFGYNYLLILAAKIFIIAKTDKDKGSNDSNTTERPFWLLLVIISTVVLVALCFIKNF